MNFEQVFEHNADEVLPYFNGVSIQKIGRLGIVRDLVESKYT